MNVDNLMVQLVPDTYGTKALIKRDSHSKLQLCECQCSVKAAPRDTGRRDGSSDTRGRGRQSATARQFHPVLLYSRNTSWRSWPRSTHLPQITS